MLRQLFLFLLSTFCFRTHFVSDEQTATSQTLFDGKTSLQNYKNFTTG